MFLLIDNYDSFTYNLYHYLIEAGAGEVLVKRNDEISCDEIRNLKNLKGIILSPGPCTPNESGVCLEIIQQFQGHFPILGVCLGHQAIGQIFGGKIIKTYPVHGKTDEIFHQGDALFAGIPSPFVATRYHSLIVERETFPEKELEIIAKNKDGIVMALKHRKFKIYGVQFHPESIACEYGKQIIANFIGLCL